MASVEIKGLDKVLATIDKKCGCEKVADSMKKACAVVEKSAKQNAPKDTGELRRSITSRVVEDEDGNIVGEVYTPLEYAPYIEYGTGLFAENGGRMDVPWNYQDDEGEWHSTSGMKPQPFMRPAINDNRLKIYEIIKEGMGFYD